MSGALVVECLTVGRWSVNCYLVHDGRAGVIIDPGDDADRIAAAVRRSGFTPRVIINTHAHFDHVGAVAPLKRMFGIPFSIHAADRRLLGQANLYRTLAGDRTLIETPVADTFLDPAVPIAVGDWHIDVLHTPGHTSGSVCFRTDGLLFSGDTLFGDGVGRTDLPGGNQTLLGQSLARLADEDPLLTLHPGHGPANRLGDALSCAHRLHVDV